ncbi:hypothetical protein [Pseudooctadecabacter sp.]|uniref:hypothetical protein n=1 Tax=Pseudooctadecabacter sp. TaxID=1966338 RepID=UPI0035C7D9A7
MKMRRGRLICAAVMSWAASMALAEDIAISDLLTGLDEDAAAVSSLNTTYETASHEEL